jgi:aminopeptidase N
MAHSLALALLLVTQATDSLMGPGVSLSLARYRAARISNVSYDLALNLTARDTARGTATIRFSRRGDGDVILDFRGYALGDLVVNGNRTSAEYNGAHLRIPASRVRDGQNTVVVRFAAPVAPAGAAVIRVTDETDRRDYLYSLLVPADANLFFPCFDQPDIKARFTVTVPAGHPPLLTNAPLSRAVASRNGVQDQRRYGPTEPISTYLFAVASGPWTQLRDSTGDIAIWVRQSRAREVEVDTIIALNRRARDWLADYFGVPYPFAKMDLLLAPAFPFGGMEHPGAIFYNEESFIYREPPTLTQRLGRQATIFHEVAHQWFGDYTTMRWFDDLWMKEGFSTFMAARMLAQTGDTTAWMSFYLRNKPTAYDVDVTAGTTPVWQELPNLDQAKSNYGAIVYNKAPAVLKQLEYLVGESAFRRGVSAFLMQHAYGNATWRELLTAIGSASGQDLTDWGSAWFLRPGMPVVEQRLVPDGAGSSPLLRLVQRPAQPLSGPGAWPMKVDVYVQGSSGADSTITVEMRSETTSVRLPEVGPLAFVYANANDHGYGWFMLDDASRDYLLAALAGAEHAAPRLRRDPFLRAMMWGSLWDLVRDARLHPRRFVDAALAALRDERDEQIAGRLLGRTSRAVTAYLPAAASAADNAALRGRVENAFLSGALDSTRSYGLRKSFFDSYVGIAASPAALDRLNAWLDSTRAAGEPLRQPTRWSIVTQLVSRNHPAAAARLAAEVARDTSTGGRRRAFIAGAAWPSEETKRSYFSRYFSDSTLNEDYVTASLGAFNDPDQSVLTLTFLRPALDTLRWVQQNRRIFFLGRWLDAFVGGHRSAQALAEVDTFLAETPDLPRDLRQKVLQTRDELERTVKIRAAWAADTALRAPAPPPS